MSARRPASAVVVMVILLFTVSLAGAQSDPVAFQRALRVPIVDGTSLAGIPLGVPETAAMGILGTPVAIRNSTIAERALHYEFADTVSLDVHVGAGVVKAISVSIAEGEATGLLPPTSRGVQIGMPTSVVAERYGASANAGFWYTAEGVGFNFDNPADEVRSVVVFARGIPAP